MRASPRAEAENSGDGSDVAVVKKYANRRLYNTATSSYVTLDELARMIREGQEFVVYDARTGEDITRSVLTQIILEEDSKGRNMLPIGFLRRLISFYDDSLHALLPRYLEMSMENFARHQDQMREYLERTFGGLLPVRQFEELTRQNMALFQQAISMFNPLAARRQEETPSASPEDAARSAAADARGAEDLGAEVEALKSRLAELEGQLEALSGRGRRRSTAQDRRTGSD